MCEEMLTGYSKIIEALTEKGRWQAERIRELETALAKSAEAQNHFCGRWLWQAMLAQQYKGDYLEAREEAKPLREIAQTLLYSLATARHESIGSIDSHRSAKYSQREIEHIRQVLERSGE